jgi:hypothetical protein
MSRQRGASSPRLEIPRKSVELEDPGAINLRALILCYYDRLLITLIESSDEEYFSDASEGRRRASRPQTPASPVPKTRVERVDSNPAYGEVPGTPAYDRRAKDAVPDEVEVVPEGRLSKRSSQYLEPPTTPGGTIIPRTVVEKVDPSFSSYGDEPGTRAYSHRKMDSIPDLVLRAPEGERSRQQESQRSPSATSPQIPETIVTRVDDEPAYGEVKGTAAADRRQQDAKPDAMEIKPDTGKPDSGRFQKNY